MTAQDTATEQAATTTTQDRGLRSAPRWMRSLIAGAVALALLVLGAALGMTLQERLNGPAQPDAASVDVGFSQDMSVHHQQAVLMAGVALERSTDPAIRSLAFDIEHTQLEQVGRMQGWLSLWNAAPLPTGRPMTWMTDTGSMPGMHGGGMAATGMATMPGMASQADLNRLGTASGKDFDVLFLQLMLRHHQGGAPMASYAAQHAETPQVRNLAQKILISQTAEAQYLTTLITQDGARPLPPPS